MIEYHGHNLILKYAPAGCSILELGNQIMNLAEAQDISAKEYYSNLGFTHTSIDINGKDGALNLDLSTDLGEIGQFDLVTDMGTTEHVPDVYNCLKNVFNACKVGGVMIHKNPKTGNFPGHGQHFFTLEFWNQYAELCSLEKLDIYPHAIYHNTKDGWECIAILKKTEGSKFLTEKQFNKISNLILNK
jgi:hypothetical protein